MTTHVIQVSHINNDTLEFSDDIGNIRCTMKEFLLNDETDKDLTFITWNMRDIAPYINMSIDKTTWVDLNTFYQTAFNTTNRVRIIQRLNCPDTVCDSELYERALKYLNNRRRCHNMVDTTITCSINLYNFMKRHATRMVALGRAKIEECRNNRQKHD